MKLFDAGNKIGQNTRCIVNIWEQRYAHGADHGNHTSSTAIEYNKNKVELQYWVEK